MVGAALAAGGLVTFGAGRWGGGFGHFGGEAQLFEGIDKHFNSGLFRVVADGDDVLLTVDLDGLHAGFVAHTGFHLVLEVLVGDLRLEGKVGFDGLAFGIGGDGEGYHEQ